MTDYLDPNLIGFIVLFAIILIAYSAIRISKKINNIKLKKKLSRGIEVEKQAAQLLENQGYSIIKYHYRKSYQLLQDKEPVTINIEADYIVKKDGKKFIAEVKSGDTATEIKTSATRRQLLEYSLFIENKGLLLVDMESQKITTIKFPIDFKPNSLGWLKIIVSLIIGVGLGAYFFKT